MLTFAEILAQYYTEEELAKLDALQEEKGLLDTKARHDYGKEFVDFRASLKAGETILVEGWKDGYLKERDRIFSEAKKINNGVLLRYKEEKKPEGILEDVKRIAEDYTKEEFLAHIKHLRDLLSLERFNVHIEAPDKEGKPYLSYLADSSEENYHNCFAWLYGNNPEIEELLDGEDLAEAIEIIKARIDTFGYERPEKGVLSYKDQRESPELPKLPKYDFVYPTDLEQNLTKASSTIFSSKNSIEDLKQISLDVSPNKKGLTTTYSVNVDLSAPELKGTENITEYDKSVHNMAISIAKANEHGSFTAKQLATALLYGDNPLNSRPSPQQIGAVTKSIEKQRHIDITIDWTEHIKLNNKGNLPEDVTAYQRKGYMLPVEEHIFTVNGKKLHGYQFIKEPPLYQYATSVGQIGQTPVKMLNVPINLDQSKIVIRDFLLEEIAHIKKNKDWNRTISVERLLDVAGEDSKTISRKKKSLLLTAVKDMFSYWKEEGYIKSYKENLKAKSIQSFTIEV